MDKKNKDTIVKGGKCGSKVFHCAKELIFLKPNPELSPLSSCPQLKFFHL